MGVSRDRDTVLYSAACFRIDATQGGLRQGDIHICPSCHTVGTATSVRVTSLAFSPGYRCEWCITHIPRLFWVRWVIEISDMDAWVRTLYYRTQHPIASKEGVQAH